MKEFFTKYFHYKFLFSLNPRFSNQAILYLLALFLLIILIGVLLYFIFNKKAKTLSPYKILASRYLKICLTPAIIGLILIFFIWQQIPYLSVPILFMVDILVFVVLIIYTVIFWHNIIKKEVQKYKQQIRYEKYLPSNKKTKRKNRKK